MWVYIVWVETGCIRYDKLAKQNVSRVFCRKTLLTRHSLKPAVTIYHDSSHSSHVLSTCFTLQEGYSWDTRENFFGLQLSWVFTLSLTHNPYNEVFAKGMSIGIANFGPELKTLTLMMFSNLYLLTNTGFINLGRAQFLCDLITGAPIDICTHIFQTKGKKVEWTVACMCLPFYSLIMKRCSFAKRWNYPSSSMPNIPGVSSNEQKSLFYWMGKEKSVQNTKEWIFPICHS